MYEKNGGYSDHCHPKLIQIGPVVQAFEQFSRMQSEREQTSKLLRLFCPKEYVNNILVILYRGPE